MPTQTQIYLKLNCWHFFHNVKMMFTWCHHNVYSDFTDVCVILVYYLLCCLQDFSKALTCWCLYCICMMCKMMLVLYLFILFFSCCFHAAACWRSNRSGCTRFTSLVRNRKSRLNLFTLQTSAVLSGQFYFKKLHDVYLKISLWENQNLPTGSCRNVSPL